jgi:hypothetical protein
MRYALGNGWIAESPVGNLERDERPTLRDVVNASSGARRSHGS